MKDILNKMVKWHELMESGAMILAEQSHKEILEDIHRDQDHLPIDFVLEALAQMGYDPCLVQYNRHWTITIQVYEPVMLGDDTLSAHTFMLADNASFFLNIRNAIKHYLETITDNYLCPFSLESQQ